MIGEKINQFDWYSFMSGRVWNAFFTTLMKLSGKEAVPSSVVGLDDFLQAIFEGDLEEVEQYFKLGYDPDAKDSSNRTALQLAVESDNVEVVEALLNRGASVNGVGFNDYTALHIAVQNSIDDVVQSDALPGEESIEILLCLLEAAADIYLEDGDGNSSISIAEQYKSKKIIALLQKFA